MTLNSILTKVVLADSQRKSRFHTGSGQLVLTVDIVPAFISSVARAVLGRRPNLPWLTYPAIRFLANRLQGRRLFEFGSGSSTLWYADRASEVYSIENDGEWFADIQQQIAPKVNCHLTLAKTDSDLLEAVSVAGGRFDAIVIDSRPMSGEFKSTDDFRVACLRSAVPYASKDCLFVIDNTDVLPALNREVERTFFGKSICRLRGWVPGAFHPSETTIVVHRAPQAELK